jgi:polyhydroxyalkanoate synthesis regulator phasin
MSLLGDLKKIFFGAKSVAKHQTERATEAAKEKFDEVSDELTEKGNQFSSVAKHKMEELSEQAKHTFEDMTEKGTELAGKGREALDGLGDKVFKEAEELADKGAELRDQGTDWINERLGSLNTSRDNSTADLEDTVNEGLELDPEDRSPTAGTIDFEAGLTDDPGFSATPKTPSAAREAANQMLDKAAKAGIDAKAAADRLGNKVMDASEEIGGKILEKGSDLLDKAAVAGAGLKEKADDFVAHANTEAEKMKMEESIEEAKRAAEQAAARARAYGDKETEKKTDESLLDGTDSFFDRAAKFADGDYHREGKVRIVDNDDPTKVELTKKGKIDITGFEDQDGDGDPLIDDAEIEED